MSENVIVDTKDLPSSMQNNSKKEKKQKNQTSIQVSHRPLPQTGGNHSFTLGIFTISGLILGGLLIKKIQKRDSGGHK